MPAPERPGLARLSIVVEGGDFVAGDGAAGLARGRADSSPRELRVRSGCPHLVRETLVLLGGASPSRPSAFGPMPCGAASSAPLLWPGSSRRVIPAPASAPGRFREPDGKIVAALSVAVAHQEHRSFPLC